MLYSTIEEAWNNPSLIESFASKPDQNETCERIISQLLKCDGCVDRLRSRLRIEVPPFQRVQKQILESFSSSLQYDREKMRTYLLAIASILTLIVMLTC